MDPIVIVGSGLAGYTLAREVRKVDKNIPLTIITRDDGAFYSKPNLSNALGGGKTPAQLAVFSAAEMAAQVNAGIRTHTTVVGIDVAAKQIATQTPDGPEQRIAWSKLVLALGADPVHLVIEGDGIDRMFSVNDLTDYARFCEHLERAQRIAILGAGLVGCEFANDLCSVKKEVHVIEPAHGPLARFLPEQSQHALRVALEQAGVNWHFGSLLAELHRHGTQVRAVLKKADDSGERRDLDVDLVLSAVGLRPRLHLAQTAGITTARGIVVDRFLRSSAADVFAFGDCAEVEGFVLPYVQPLMAAARALAKTVTGTATPLIWPPMPVVVKTPAYPVVVLPVLDPRPGAWSVDVLADGVRAIYTDVNGWMRGFALTGSAVAEKNALVKKIPGLIE